MEGEIKKNVVWHRSGVSNVGCVLSVAPYCHLSSMKLPAKTEDFARGLSALPFQLYANITIHFLAQYNALNGTHQTPFFFKNPLLFEILSFWNITPFSLVLYVASVIKSCTLITQAAGPSGILLHFY